MNSDTLFSRPLPRRPDTGLAAWQATIGYLSSEYSPDAMLTLRVTSGGENSLRWAAGARWGQYEETVRDRETLPAALRDLWPQIEANHRVFKSMDAAVKQPKYYNDDQWLDEDTHHALNRLLRVVQAAFVHDWTLMLYYQPISTPDLRVQARLLAKQNQVQVSGHGPSIRDACRDVYYNAAPHFAAVYRTSDDVF